MHSSLPSHFATVVSCSVTSRVNGGAPSVGYRRQLILILVETFELHPIPYFIIHRIILQLDLIILDRF